MAADCGIGLYQGQGRRRVSSLRSGAAPPHSITPMLRDVSSPSPARPAPTSDLRRVSALFGSAATTFTESTVPETDRDSSATPGIVAGQPKVWTFIDFEAPDEIADELAHAMADGLKPDFGWWADFRIGDGEHVIICPDRVFRYRVGD
jgi:hypothetical protein